jgi:hypothetical protein
LCRQTHLLSSLGERLPPLRSTWSSGTWQGQPSQQAWDTKQATRMWKHHPPNPRWAPRNVAWGLRQRQRGYQNLQEASLLSKPAVTQQTQVQSLSLESKGGFPYIPFRAGYRNERLQLVLYIITCYFIGFFNLWGKVTLLWSPGNIPQLWFFFVSL